MSQGTPKDNGCAGFMTRRVVLPTGRVNSLRPPGSKVYRRRVAARNGLRRGTWIGPPTVLTLLLGCTSVDPGPDFVVPQTVFDANYFY